MTRAEIERARHDGIVCGQIAALLSPKRRAIVRALLRIMLADEESERRGLSIVIVTERPQ